MKIIRPNIIAITILSYLILALSTNSVAQHIRGYVLNIEGDPLPETTISLCTSDSITQQQTRSDADGLFLLPHISQPHIVKAIKTGYEPYYQRIEECDSLLYITLQPAGTNLEEFTVTARRPNMTVESGRFIFDPGELTGLVSNASRILDYVPILKRGDEEYSIVSKQNHSAHIFINGEEPVISQGSVMDWLRQLPASSIVRVEIITTPDATNSTDIINGGIINIIVKDKVTGYFGNLSMAGNLRDNGNMYSLNPGANFYFQNGNFLFNIRGNYQYLNSKGLKYHDFKDFDKDISRLIVTSSNNKNQMLRLDAVAQYNFGKNSLSVTFADGAFYNKDHTVTDQTEELGGHTETISNTREQLTPLYHSMLTGVRYQYLINKDRGSKLTAKYNIMFAKPLNVTDKLYDSLHESLLVNQSQRMNAGSHGLTLGYENMFSDQSTLHIKANLSYN